MEVKNFRSWFTFEKEIQHSLREHRQASIEAAQYFLLFRGQSDAKWHLETTLERMVGPKISLFNHFYYDLVPTVARVETFTDKKWILPSVSEYRRWLRLVTGQDEPEDDSENPLFDPIPAFDYMAYLRHHSYPSPLIDWTYSPFVAAYFAFRDTTSDAKSVAIYSYAQGFTEYLYYSLSEEPTIIILRENVHTNKRHYLQQSVYTTCIKIENGEAIYASHEAISSDPKTILTKYILPSSERAKALRSLDAYNINSYSLFGTEESLLETIFLRQYIQNKENEESDLLFEKYRKKRNDGT